MTLHLNAILSPQLLRDNAVLRNSITVVIDVFRATTTIAVALENGALEIVPVGTIKDAEAKAKELRGRLGEKSVLLCGERGGIKPDGFDLGNSPLGDCQRDGFCRLIDRKGCVAKNKNAHPAIDGFQIF